jgi:hypothetical protein
MPQTSVSDMSAGLAGMLADSGLKDAAGVVQAEASASIPFGVMVAKGSTDDAAVKLNGTASSMITKLLGVVMFSHRFAIDHEVDSTGIKPKVGFDVLRRGRIYVLPEESVTPGDPVRVRVVVTGGEVAGAFRKTEDSTDCVNISAFAQWRTSGSSTVPAVLEIDMTGLGDAVADDGV